MRLRVADRRNNGVLRSKNIFVVQPIRLLAIKVAFQAIVVIEHKKMALLVPINFGTIIGVVGANKVFNFRILFSIIIITQLSQENMSA